MAVGCEVDTINHLFSTYLLSSYYVLSLVLEAEDKLDSNRENVSPAWNLHSLLIYRLRRLNPIHRKPSSERFTEGVGPLWPAVQIWPDNHFHAA